MPLDISSVGQISRTVSDVGQSVAWYRDVLGLEHLFTFDKLAFFQCGGTRLMLSQNEELQPAESLIYFRVSDVKAAHSALTGKGVEFLQGPELVHRHADGTEEWMAFFKDPEGRALAVMAQVPPAA
jgi:catechol 2,3-dioxygenase-like lactoylglutathione lyase family enzyme